MRSVIWEERQAYDALEPPNTCGEGDTDWGMLYSTLFEGAGVRASCENIDEGEDAGEENADVLDKIIKGTSITETCSRKRDDVPLVVVSEMIECCPSRVLVRH